MLGPITVGRKAAKWGYKRYGVPGAVATGAAGVAGYVAARRALRGKLKGEEGQGNGSDTDGETA